MDISKAFEGAFNRKIGFEPETDWIKVIEVLRRF